MRPVGSLCQDLIVSTALLFPLVSCEGPELYEQQIVTANFHYGPRALLRLPPLHERGVRTLGVVYEPMDRLDLVVLDTDGDHLERDQVRAEPLLPRDEIELLLLDQINRSPHIAGRILRPAEVRTSKRVIELPDPKSHSDPIPRASLEDLRAKGVDAVLIVREVSLPDGFFGVSPSDSDFGEDCNDGNLAAGVVCLGIDVIFEELFPELSAAGDFGAKGIYWNPFLKHPYAFAGFQVSLIETVPGREAENGTFIQASAERLEGFPWKRAFEIYSAAEQGILVAAVKRRIAYNAEQALVVFKALPAEDGEFLSYTETPRPYDERTSR